MSTELETIEEHNTSPAVHATSFFGGRERGRCVQLTQSHRNSNDGLAIHGIPAQMLTLNEKQAWHLIAVLREWLDGEAPVTEERVRELIAEREEELANEVRLV